jgi:glycerate 2-kinase
LRDLGRDSLAIFEAGLRAVDSGRLVRSALRADDETLWIAGDVVDLSTIDRIAVVGAGKAGGGMVCAVEGVLGPRLIEDKGVHGWVNVPEDCVQDTQVIHLHPARPPGVNEPTLAAAHGAARILETVADLGPSDLCLCLISGGGSALLPAPVPAVTLADKIAVTRQLSAAGADIGQLNTVRKHLSAIKGGGLARACTAGRLVTLVISDVLGDPLDLIASGPTVADTSSPTDALAVLEAYGGREAGIPDHVLTYLRSAPAPPDPPPATSVTHIIGNLDDAARAAARRAEEMGYDAEVEVARAPEGPVEEVAGRLCDRAREMRSLGGRRCLVSGGEPTVTLPSPAERGRGGRNQQLALAALTDLRRWEGVALLSAGTDGEDGPTDAAGALVDAALAEKAREAHVDPLPFLRRCDAYSFFADLDGLVVTGPTHTNVCDLRVLLTRS